MSFGYGSSFFSCEDTDKDRAQHTGKPKQNAKALGAVQGTSDGRNQKGDAWQSRKAEQALAFTFRDPPFVIECQCHARPNGEAAEKTEQDHGTAFARNAEKRGNGSPEAFAEKIPEAARDQQLRENHKGEKGGKEDVCTKGESIFYAFCRYRWIF